MNTLLYLIGGYLFFTGHIIVGLIILTIACDNDTNLSNNC